MIPKSLIALTYSIALLTLCTCPITHVPTAAADETSNSKKSVSESTSADPKNLQKLFSKLQKAIRTNDTKTAVNLTKRFLPDDASLGKAVKNSEALRKIKQMHAQFSTASDEQIATLFAAAPNQTQINVHAATTEQLIAYDKNGTAFKEFPEGAKVAADMILQPQMTFYEIELVEPGNDAGMKYHLFFHDGKNWKMLGPVWRVLRE